MNDVNGMVDSAREFKHKDTGLSISDGAVLSMARLAFERAVSWTSIESYGDEVLSRAREFYDALTNG